MKLTHTGDDGLAGLVVGLDSEGWILLGEFAESDSELVKVALGLRLDSDTDNRIRELHRLENDRMVLVADGVTGTEILETDCCTDVTGLDEFDRILVVRVHLVQTGDSLLFACTDIVYV